ncbi:hypothetical protein StoSoilB13_31440 (plasmid) [Arthrobacter sp. StoSoilB13]|nr:hypothetical protein StoSoilB13_31440 [Arthrobacter sp. StoSoilB13]
MAIGTILAARDFGLRIPEDLSVIGIDGHDLGKVMGLTTIDQDAKGQGALAVRTLRAPSTMAWSLNHPILNTPPGSWFVRARPCPGATLPRLALIPETGLPPQPTATAPGPFP